jgi:hypothetical protein
MIQYTGELLRKYLQYNTHEEIVAMNKMSEMYIVTIPAIIK